MSKHISSLLLSLVIFQWPEMVVFVKVVQFYTYFCGGGSPDLLTLLLVEGESWDTRLWNAVIMPKRSTGTVWRCCVWVLWPTAPAGISDDRCERGRVFLSLDLAPAAVTPSTESSQLSSRSLWSR